MLRRNMFGSGRESWEGGKIAVILKFKSRTESHKLFGVTSFYIRIVFHSDV